MLYIGVDLGTSAVKLLMMDENGNIQKIVSKEYPLYFPYPGWSEQNPQDWFAQSMEGIKELTSECDKSQVAGISFGGQMHGLVVLDDEDEVIRPAILWNDGRTTKETDYLNMVIGKETLSKYTANIAFAGFTAPKILWMKENEPELFAKINKIMLPKDYLAYKLSGTFCTDYSDASGMLLLDVQNKCWSQEMIDICGIRQEQLPKLFESYEVVGSLKQEIAEELGLSKTVKVIAGAGDNAAAAVGTGTVGDGRCNLSLGTSGTIFISSKQFGVDENNALHSFDHADGYYHLMGCMLSAASCNKWWMDEILKTKEYAKEVYAQFALGEAYNLCKPYSYESLKMDMEAENQQRQAKKSAGEVVYGTLEYTLDSYLEYTLSNLKIQTVDYMVRNHEESLEKEAKTYWEAHPDKFERVDEIIYRLGEETKTVIWDELSTLEKTDSELFEYLYYGEEGEQFTLSDRDEPISGEILKKAMKTTDFETDKSTVLKIYISDVYYEKLVKQAEKEHPLEFELNQG